MFLDAVEQAAKELQADLALGLNSPKRTILCSQTGKPVVYFRLDSPSFKDAFMCLDCGISKLHTPGYSKHNVILLEELADNLLSWVKIRRTPKIDTEGIDHFFKQLDFVLCK